MLYGTLFRLLFLAIALASAEKQDSEPLPAAPTSTTLEDVTFHVLSLRHTAVRDDFSPCAFTMKVKRLCSMLKSLGFKSILYANEGSVSDCDRLEVILTDEERQQFYGPDSTWKSGKFFNFESEEGKDLFNERTIDAVAKNKDPDGVDFLLATWGYGHYDIAVATDLTAIETGIGYPQSFARFRVYESYSFLHIKTGGEIVNYYHAVIPNCYYASEFEGATRPPSIQGRYVAFVGRIMTNKGFAVVLETFKYLPEDYTLHVAGQGDIRYFVPEGHPLYDRVIFHGVLGPKERNDLLVGAEVLLAPTKFREPFGGVMVEAQMLGTPVVTTDHAAFAETVWHGVTGYRCRTLRCFVAAAKQAHLLDRDVIARRANETYSCHQVQYQYEDYFQDVLDVKASSGWYSMEDGPGHTLEQKHFYPLVDAGMDGEQGANGSCEAVSKFSVYTWIMGWVELVTGWTTRVYTCLQCEVNDTCGKAVSGG